MVIRSLLAVVALPRLVASLVPGGRVGVRAPAARGSRARRGSSATGRFVVAPARRERLFLRRREGTGGTAQPALADAAGAGTEEGCGETRAREGLGLVGRAEKRAHEPI
jgi:hypothetical protein